MAWLVPSGFPEVCGIQLGRGEGVGWSGTMACTQGMTPWELGAQFGYKGSYWSDGRVLKLNCGDGCIT